MSRRGSTLPNQPPSGAPGSLTLAFMLRILAVCLGLLAPPLWGFTKIPETIQVGSYSVSLKLGDTWFVQVFEKQGCITYSGQEKTSQGIATIEIRVYCVSLPPETALLDGAVAAARLVRDDGLKFQQSIFRHRFLFPKAPVVIQCPVGTAFIYAEDDSSFHDSRPHFARAALVLPQDYQ